jgi:hypothetical protein
MKQIPDEDTIVELIRKLAPEPGPGLDRRLSAAPWTHRAVLRRRLVIGSIFTVLALVTISTFTPQGRAMAASLLRFFRRAETQVVLLPTMDAVLSVPTHAVQTSLPVEVQVPDPQPANPGTVQPDCGTELSPKCTLEQVQGLVDFPLKEIDELPAGMEFNGASISEKKGVLFTYRGQEGDLNLTQIPVEQDAPELWRIGPQAAVESLAIGNTWGEYVRGSWMGLSGDGTVVWDAEQAQQTLRWMEDGIQYSLWFLPARTDQGPLPLEKSKLVEIASSLGLPVNHNAGSPSIETTVAQAGELAGFTVSQPPDLPTGFSFSTAINLPEKSGVCLLYQYHVDEVYPALILHISTGGLPRLEEIQTLALYNGVPVEIAANIETMSLAGAENERGTIISTGLEPSRLCGSEQTYANRALMWQAGGKSFALFANLDQLDGRGYLSKLEMAAFAEALNGAPSRIRVEPDSERLLSIESAEGASGLDLKFPQLMFSGLYFDHISLTVDGPYRPGDGETTIAALYTGRPIGDGRAYKMLILQVFNPQNDLQNLALAGGYQPATVHQQSAIYRQDCWGLTEPGAGCTSYLTWFENDVQFDIEAFLPAALPRETLIAIAESLR